MAATSTKSQNPPESSCTVIGGVNHANITIPLALKLYPSPSSFHTKSPKAARNGRLCGILMLTHHANDSFRSFLSFPSFYRCRRPLWHAWPWHFPPYARYDRPRDPNMCGQILDVVFLFLQFIVTSRLSVSSGPS